MGLPCSLRAGSPVGTFAPASIPGFRSGRAPRGRCRFFQESKVSPRRGPPSLARFRSANGGRRPQSPPLAACLAMAPWVPMQSAKSRLHRFGRCMNSEPLRKCQRCPLADSNGLRARLSCVWLGAVAIFRLMPFLGECGPFLFPVIRHPLASQLAQRSGGRVRRRCQATSKVASLVCVPGPCALFARWDCSQRRHTKRHVASPCTGKALCSDSATLSKSRARRRRGWKRGRLLGWHQSRQAGVESSRRSLFALPQSNKANLAPRKNPIASKWPLPVA